MTQLPPSLTRLGHANPVDVNDERGRSPDAQATLSRILASDHAIPRRAAPRRGRRLLIIAMAALLLAAAAALAATDPFGFWRSATPGTAQYAVDPTRHVHTPTAQNIGCQQTNTQSFRCGAHLQGRRYTQIDQISPRSTTRLDRETVHTGVLTAAASGQISPQLARRIEADLAAVPDSFFPHLNEAMRFATTSFGPDPVGGKQLVPPMGVPALIVCEPAGNLLICRDLNGDEHAAVGSGVYGAVPTADWKPAPPNQPDQSNRLTQAIFGHPLSRAESRLLIDLVAPAISSSGGSSGSQPPTTTTPPATSPR